jgi:5'-3' exonuclease
LPHLPGLNINEQAFDIIFDAYKNLFISDPGYIVNNCDLDASRLEFIFTIIGVSELNTYEEKEKNRILKEMQIERSKKKYAELKILSGNNNNNINNNNISYNNNDKNDKFNTKSNDNISHNKSNFDSIENIIMKTNKLNLNTTSDNNKSNNDNNNINNNNNNNNEDNFETEKISFNTLDLDHREDYYFRKFSIDLKKFENSINSNNNKKNNVKNDVKHNVEINDDNDDKKDIENLLEIVVKKYLEGLKWCLCYYTKGFIIIIIYLFIYIIFKLLFTKNAKIFILYFFVFFF